MTQHEAFYLENAMALVGARSLYALAKVIGVQKSYLYNIRDCKCRFGRPLFMRLLEVTDKRPSEMYLELCMPPDYFEDKR